MSTYTFSSVTNNKNISPLYIYTKNGIDREVNQLFLISALVAVDSAINDCCFTRHPISKNAFLNTYYKLLNGMPRKGSLNKLKAVRTILTNKLSCCFPNA